MQRRIPKFDPIMVPIKSTSDNPAIASEFLLPDSLRQRFMLPKIWMPEVTDESRQSILHAKDLKKRIAAVLIPLVSSQDGLDVLFTKRAAHLNDHAGQISFPGGRKEEYDADLIATALREAHEEIGLENQLVETLGNLPDYFTITGYQVTPVVGLVESIDNLVPDINEVDEIFRVPLSFLMNPANHQIREWIGPEGARSFYAMPYQDRFIWGATAGMLRNLYHFLRV